MVLAHRMISYWFTPPLFARDIDAVKELFDICPMLRLTNEYLAYMVLNVLQNVTEFKSSYTLC